MRAKDEIEHIFSELYSVPDCLQKPYFQIKVQELLLFLYLVDVKKEKQREIDQEVRLDIATNGWREVADYFLDRITNCDAVKIRFLHAIVWLSLTTYTWEDYDSICGAFYNGTYLLEEFL